MNQGQQLHRESGQEAAGSAFAGREMADAMRRLREGTGERSRREIAAFLRDAKRPRSEAYMRSLSRLAALTAKRRQLRGEAAGGSAADAEQEEALSAGNDAASGPVGDEAGRDVAETVGAERAGQSSEELARIEREIEDAERTLAAERPQGSVLLTMIFWDVCKEALVQRGFLAAGDYDSYESTEELIRRCGAENDERARAQLALGDRVFHADNGASMAAEIYLDAICLIYPDGTVRVVREDPQLGL